MIGTQTGEEGMGPAGIVTWKGSGTLKSAKEMLMEGDTCLFLYISTFHCIVHICIKDVKLDFRFHLSLLLSDVIIGSQYAYHEKEMWLNPSAVNSTLISTLITFRLKINILKMVIYNTTCLVVDGMELSSMRIDSFKRLKSNVA